MLSVRSLLYFGFLFIYLSITRICNMVIYLSSLARMIIYYTYYRDTVSYSESLCLASALRPSLALLRINTFTCERTISLGVIFIHQFGKCARDK